MQHFGVCKKRAFGIPMPLPGLLNDKYRQAVRIMKITAFILLVCTLHVSAAGYSQSITLSEKEAPLDKIFKSIEKQTDYIFFYNVDWVSKAQKVNVEVKNMQLQQVLDLLFKNQPLAYSITGKMITVFPKKDESNPATQTAGPPPIDIQGKVVDENGKPVAGVTVTIKGTKKQTITKENGEFSFSGVESNAVLTFSSVNMEPFTINVSGRNEILAKLKTKTSELDEVQVIAYGQITKRFQTGSVATVKSTDIEKQSINNPLLALQGRVPGMYITQNSGVPGAGVTARIRGINSISNGNDPLYVVDGVPFVSQLLPGIGGILGNSGASNVANANGNPLSYINPADIESIEILKDGDATSIYGSRAANGAVLITTKNGHQGKTAVIFNIQSGTGTNTRRLDLLNTRQYLDMRYEAIKNDGTTITDPSVYAPDLTQWDTTRYTDWQKKLIGGSAKYFDAHSSISGGNANTQFSLSGSYHRETSVFDGDFSDNKGSVHFSVNNVTANQRFAVAFIASYLVDDNKLPAIDMTGAALTLAPNAPDPYNSNGTLNWATPISGGFGTFANPYASLKINYRNQTKNLISNATIRYEIIKGLEAKVSLGYTNLQVNETKTTPLTSFDPYLVSLRGSSLRKASYTDNKINSWIVEPQLKFDHIISKGKLEVLIGSTIQQNNSSGLWLNGSGYNSDVVLEDIKSASTVAIGSTINSVYKYSAIFGRINYNLQNKYILNLTTRRDGSSRFGAANQFSNFNSAGVAWIFSNENLFKKTSDLISFGKLRASYGTTGNDQIGDYQFMDLYTPTNYTAPYQNYSGLRVNNLSNPYLEWEQTKKFEAGLELGFIKDRILISISSYQNRSSNQLLGYTLPAITGFTSITKNLPATVQNSGFEFSITTTNINKSNFKWSSSFNLTIPKNKLVKFDSLSSSGYSSALKIGAPVTILNVYHMAGVDPTMGVYQFLDFHGTPTTDPVSPTDATVMINTAPKFYGGFQNTFSYRGFYLDIFIQYVKQIGKNYLYGFLPGYFGQNQPATVLGRWQKPGDAVEIQRFNQDQSIYNSWNSAQTSDQFYSDASFIRLKTVALSWEVPNKWKQVLHIINGSVFIKGQNLLTITNYKGLDPENQSSTSLPPMRICNAGVKIGF